MPLDTAGHLRILLADDHALFREGLRLVLHRLGSEVEVVETGDFHETVAACDKGRYDLALVDLAMPGMDGVSGVRALAERLGETPVVVVSAIDAADSIRRALLAGALGYIPKTLDSAQLIQALKSVSAGHRYLPPGFDAAAQSLAASEVAAFGRLTPRQLDVLNLVAEGWSNKEIARTLGLAEGTVKLHVTALLRSLGASNRTQAVSIARTNGLIA